jgi:hypothetical protein
VLAKRVGFYFTTFSKYALAFLTIGSAGSPFTTIEDSSLKYLLCSSRRAENQLNEPSIIMSLSIIIVLL